MDDLAQGAHTDEADMLRASAYTLLAQMLARPPSRELLGAVAALRGDGTPLGQALGSLAAHAAEADPAELTREYNALFIGVDRGELVPYASYYRTGFLHEKPLAHLRQDLEALGVERAPGIPEPEDHIATICEVMAGLITGAYGAPAGLDEQQRFHDRHLRGWAERFFADLETAQCAGLYRPLGTVGRLFLEIEADAFAMADAG